MLFDGDQKTAVEVIELVLSDRFPDLKTIEVERKWPGFFAIVVGNVANRLIQTRRIELEVLRKAKETP